jgi:hypothetical protein
MSNAINRTSFYRLSVAARKLAEEPLCLTFPSSASVQGLKVFLNLTYILYNKILEKSNFIHRKFLYNHHKTYNPSILHHNKTLHK